MFRRQVCSQFSGGLSPFDQGAQSGANVSLSLAVSAVKTGDRRAKGARTVRGRAASLGRTSGCRPGGSRVSGGRSCGGDGDAE